MTTLDALEEAIALTRRTLDDSGANPTAPTPCADFDVASLTGHFLWTHDLLVEALGGEGTSRTQDRQRDHPAVTEAALNAWRSRGIEGSINIGGNELPAEFGLSLHVLEAYVHGWDLARATGSAFDPTAALTHHAWNAARMIVTDDARSGDGSAPYGSEMKPSPTADNVERLIAFTGHNPNWGSGRTTDQ